MKTLPNSQATFLSETEFPLMRSPAGSPVKTSVSSVKEKELKKEQDQDFGAKSLDLLANYDRKSSSCRTSQTCFLAQANNEAGGLAEFSETWPQSGMMRNGSSYRLPTLVQDNFGKGLSLWPTPLAADFKGGRSSPRTGKARPEMNSWQDFCSLMLGQRYPVPEVAEMVMGFPEGWTEINP